MKKLVNFQRFLGTSVIAATVAMAGATFAHSAHANDNVEKRRELHKQHRQERQEMRKEHRAERQAMRKDIRSNRPAHKGGS